MAATFLAHMARWQVVALAVMAAAWRIAGAGGLGSLLEGGLLVTFNLGLSQAMLPLTRRVQARGGSPARQMSVLGMVSLGKMALQLGVAAAVLLTWPPKGAPFLLGLASFVGGALGAAGQRLAVGMRAGATAGNGPS